MRKGNRSNGVSGIAGLHAAFFVVGHGASKGLSRKKRTYARRLGSH